MHEARGCPKTPSILLSTPPTPGTRTARWVPTGAQRAGQASPRDRQTPHPSAGGYRTLHAGLPAGTGTPLTWGLGEFTEARRAAAAGKQYASGAGNEAQPPSCRDQRRHLSSLPVSPRVLSHLPSRSRDEWHHKPRPARGMSPDHVCLRVTVALGAVSSVSLPCYTGGNRGAGHCCVSGVSWLRQRWRSRSSLRVVGPHVAQGPSHPSSGCAQKLHTDAVLINSNAGQMEGKLCVDNISSTARNPAPARPAPLPLPPETQQARV